MSGGTKGTTSVAEGHRPGPTRVEPKTGARIPVSGNRFRPAAAVYPPMIETYQTIELETTVDEDEPVFRWRLEQLERAGYDECSALELASRSDVDLHVAVDL